MINKIKSLVNKWIIKYLLLILLVLIVMYLVWINTKYLITSNYFGFNESYLDKDIVIVAIDEKTLNSDKFKRYWDLNRSDYASLLRNIAYWDPKAIWVDIFFVNNSENPTEDTDLKELINQFDNIVIWSEVDNWGEILPSVADISKVWYVNTISYDNLDIYWLNDTTIKNKIPLYYHWNTQSVPLSVKTYIKSEKISELDINDNYIKLWDKEIRLDKSDLNINYFAGFDVYNKYGKVVSFIDVIDWTIDSSFFRDKVVFVWATARDIHDEFYTPYAPNDFMPWVLIHANAYNTLSSWKHIVYQSLLWFLFLNWLFLILFVSFIISTSNIYRWMLYSFWALFAFILISIAAFYLFWYLIEIIPIIAWFILINTTLFIIKFLEEKKSKDQIRGIFAKYVSKDVVDQIIKSWVDDLGLWGASKNITVFFSDLAWFTNLSEDLNPQDLGKILNIYFENMSSIILSKSGTIDKFIWDAIMAFWNAPLDIDWHQQLACECAIIQRKALDKVRQELRIMWYNTEIDMRIWINTWQAVVWNFGCSTRYDYTALGDSVNLASRLESINKQYWTNIIISQDTYDSIDKWKFFIRKLDEITVKWKSHPVTIYEIMDFRSEDVSLQNIINSFEKALLLYQEWHFAQAKEIFDILWDDKPSKIFSQRCKEFMENQISIWDWDWVYKFKVK